MLSHHLDAGPVFDCREKLVTVAVLWVAANVPVWTRIFRQLSCEELFWRCVHRVHERHFARAFIMEDRVAGPSHQVLRLADAWLREGLSRLPPRVLAPLLAVDHLLPDKVVRRVTPLDGERNQLAHRHVFDHFVVLAIAVNGRPRDEVILRLRYCLCQGNFFNRMPNFFGRYRELFILFLADRSSRLQGHFFN